jgi:PAS domain S-box-containing protein
LSNSVLSVDPLKPLQSERVFRYLVESIEDYAIFLLTPEGIIASWNPGAERLEGYKAEEIIGQHFSKFYPPEDLASNKPAKELEVAEAQGSLEDEGWRLRKDGSRFWASVVISRVLDDDGNLVGFGKITRDLTERRETEQQYRRLIEGVSDYAIYSLDPKGNVTSWNAGVRRLKGYEAHEIVGQHFSRFYGEEDVARGLPQHVLDTAAREGHFEGEGWRVRKDGTRFWSSVVVTPIRNDEGTLIGFSKITRDVSDRKALLDRIQQHSEELEIRIKQQEQTNAELEAFSYSVSHDLRAPLRAIDGFSNIILEEFGNKLPGQAKDYLHEVITAAGRMNRLVQDLLDYSRLSRVDLEATPVNVAAAIDDVCGQIESEVRSQIAVDVDPNLQVKAHGAVVRQAIFNLINNALKFAKPGTQPKVEVKAFRRGKQAHILVKDEGIGIAPQHRERVFKVFERLHNSEEYPGTGIGLAIVKRGITRMGGSIGLESELGKGSTFEIRLPAA